MKKLILLGFLMFVFCSFVVAQNDIPNGTVMVHQDENRTVYIVNYNYPEAGLLLGEIGDVNKRIDSLELKIESQSSIEPRQKFTLSLSDYISFLSLAISIIIFFIVLRTKKSQNNLVGPE